MAPQGVDQVGERCGFDAGHCYLDGCDADPCRVTHPHVEAELNAISGEEIAAKYADPEALSLPTDSEERKAVPLARGLLDYFPAALAEVARLSMTANEKHNPGEEMHWSRHKSSDHADCIVRHLVDRGEPDPDDGFLHDVKVAWRALALLQEELERRGAPMARGAR